LEKRERESITKGVDNAHSVKVCKRKTNKGVKNLDM
jgi:hypothetical protein